MMKMKIMEMAVILPVKLKLTLLVLGDQQPQKTPDSNAKMELLLIMMPLIVLLFEEMEGSILLKVEKMEVQMPMMVVTLLER